MTTITLPLFDIVIELDEESADTPGAYGGGSITSSLLDGEQDGNSEAAVAVRAGMDAIESLILAHAVAGIDVASPAYLEGIEVAVDAVANNLG